ncbi:MAG: lysophospholipid acyltransferase family protein [Prevotella sp.]|nr:lysophospholipid acyltransferase family protein [Prevotella sp.]
MKKFSYPLLRGIVKLLSLLPFWILYGLADCFFVLIFYLVRYRRKVVRKNLAASFPEKGEKELKKTERQFYRWLCDYGVETIKLLTISDKNLLKRIEFRGVEQLEHCFDQGQDCAAILGHYCNWEWLSATGLAFQRHPDAVMGLIYHPLYSDAFDRLFIDIRSAHGGSCIPKKDILRHLLTLRDKQQHYLFGYISDQAPRWMNIHLWLRFLNQDTPVFSGGERIMRKMKNAVFYVDMERPCRGRYICTFRLISREPWQLDEHAVTMRFFALLEESIRRQPAYYLWTHNRWKRTKEEFDQKYDLVNGRTIPKEPGVYGS